MRIPYDERFVPNCCAYGCTGIEKVRPLNPAGKLMQAPVRLLWRSSRRFSTALAAASLGKQHSTMASATDIPRVLSIQSHVVHGYVVR